MSNINCCANLMKENEKLRQFIKRIKKENDDLKKKLDSLQDKEKVAELMRNFVTTRVAETQTEVRRYQPSTMSLQATNKKPADQGQCSTQLTKMTVMYNNLMKRYEKELKNNMENTQTISTNMLRINELEVKLNEAEKESHEIQIQLRLADNKIKCHAKETKQRKSRSAVQERRHVPRAFDNISADSDIEDTLQELQIVKRDRDKLRKENRCMKQELKCLDKNFFDEIEDIKYALQQSAKLNKEYEKCLRTICQNYGITYPHPEHRVFGKSR